MLSKEDRKLIARALGGHAVRNLKAWGTVTLDEDRLAALLAAARGEAAPVVDETELRPSVLAFARLMEAKLRANDHKSGWSGEDFFDLFDRLIEETSELHNALCRHAKRLSWGDSWVMEDTKAWVGEEAADVANFAMMIADVCAALEAALTQPNGGQRDD